MSVQAQTYERFKGVLAEVLSISEDDIQRPYNLMGEKEECGLGAEPHDFLDIAFYASREFGVKMEKDDLHFFSGRLRSGE